MLVIVADDLTGALDAAAPFAARGLHTEVVLKADGVGSGLALSPDVLSINLASRETSAEEGFAMMRALVGHLPAGARLFKKVDSRLKGHIAAELDAICYGRALVAPAIPAFGRVVRNGHVDGFGVDAPISVAGALKQHADRALIPDTASEDDLQAALDPAEGQGVDLLVGARGLAEALARKMTGQAPPGLSCRRQGRGFSSSARGTGSPSIRSRSSAGAMPSPVIRPRMACWTTHRCRRLPYVSCRQRKVWRPFRPMRLRKTSP